MICKGQDASGVEAQLKWAPDIKADCDRFGLFYTLYRMDLKTLLPAFVRDYKDPLTI